MFNKKNKMKPDENFLLYKPLRNIEKWEVTDGKVKLIFTNNKPIEKFIRGIIKKSTVTDMEFDEMGSTVWQLSDGTKNIYDISIAMMQKFNDTEQSSMDRVVMFVRYLAAKGWITLEKQSVI